MSIARRGGTSAAAEKALVVRVVSSTDIPAGPFMKPDTFAPKVAQNQRTYRKDRKKQGPGVARGSKCGNAVMDEDTVRTIRAMRMLGMGPRTIQRELAADGKVFSERTVQAVAYGTNWAWVT